MIHSDSSQEALLNNQDVPMFDGRDGGSISRQDIVGGGGVLEGSRVVRGRGGKGRAAVAGRQPLFQTSSSSSTVHHPHNSSSSQLRQRLGQTQSGGTSEEYSAARPEMDKR